MSFPTLPNIERELIPPNIKRFEAPRLRLAERADVAPGLGYAARPGWKRGVNSLGLETSVRSC